MRLRTIILITVAVFAAVIGLSAFFSKTMQNHDLSMLMSFVVGAFAGWPLGLLYWWDSRGTAR